MFAIIVHFNIQKLKIKQTFLQTEKAKSSHFDRTRGDKNQIFPTKGTTDIDKEGLRAVIKKLPYIRGMMILHKWASFSMSSSISMSGGL